jgi:DivIVA domain-containing protein
VILFFVLIVVLLIGLTTAAVMGKIGGFMADPTSSQSFGGVPDGGLSADSLAYVHFDQALRGYRMNQVDEVIDALGARVRALEAEVAARSLIDAESPPAGETAAPGTDEFSTDELSTDEVVSTDEVSTDEVNPDAQER